MLAPAPDTFCDDLNAAVAMVPALPRVRFDIDLGDDGPERWLKKKHADGAVHEPATIAAFLAIRQRVACKTIFDVGALWGYFSLLAAALFEDAEVTAFEMHPGAIAPLKRNVGPFVKVVHAALSDVERLGTKVWLSGFNIFEEPLGGWDKLSDIPGAMKPRGVDNRGRGFTKVDFTTLDAYCAANPAPDLIKIDVEAYQAKAIRGGLKAIQRHRPAILIELHDPEKVARLGTTNKETVQPLFELNYTAFWCPNFRSPEARFETVEQMCEAHERLSLMVFVPEGR